MADLPMPFVVPRDEVPIVSGHYDGRVELRAFAGNGRLRGASPESLDLAWLVAGPGEELPLRSSSSPSMLVLFDGTAELVGSNARELEAGDVVTLPENRAWGLHGVGPAGVRALLVTFLVERIKEVRTLAGLLARNEERVKQALEGPYFALLRSGALGSERSRRRFRDAARVFSDAFQTILLARQATCRDERFARIFHEHLEEELGHNELLTVPAARLAPKDPILRATSDWFCHQMIVLDNIEKAALVHLVLETAGYHFHTLAEPVLACDVSAEYFHVHAEADDDHKDVVTTLLENQHMATYKCLHRVVEKGWDMFDAMTNRIVHLVELSHVSS